jgi:hypothetical protein
VNHAAGALAILAAFAAPQDPKSTEKILKERATLLRSAKKLYAAFVEANPAMGEIRLRSEEDGEEKTWALDAEAEIRIRGWWGGLEDLVPGERIWFWVRPDREGKLRAIFMVADEISEQDIHQVPYALSSVDVERREIEVRRKLDGKTEEVRSLRVPDTLAPVRDGDDVVLGAAARVKPGGTVFIQASGKELLRIATPEGLPAVKSAQKERMEARWRKTGLPGTVTGLHAVTGEIEILLDHEAMHWGRALKAGDPVKIHLDRPVTAVTLEVRPWNERTRVLLAAAGREFSDVTVGRRIRIGVPEPAAEVLASHLPPDAGRPRDSAARADWVLASTYCACSIAGDGCTGMYYTLAACNGMTCGMLKRVRTFLAPLIEKGLSDRELLEAMEKEFGAAIWKPHLLR